MEHQNIETFLTKINIYRKFQDKPEPRSSKHVYRESTLKSVTNKTHNIPKYQKNIKRAT